MMAATASERRPKSSVIAMSSSRVRPIAAIAPQATAKNRTRFGSGSHRSISRTPSRTMIRGMSASTIPMPEASAPRAQTK